MNEKRLAFALVAAGILVAPGCSSSSGSGPSPTAPASASSGASGSSGGTNGSGASGSTPDAAAPSGSGGGSHGGTPDGGASAHAMAYPRIKPPVEAAAPPALGGSGGQGGSHMKRPRDHEPHPMELSVADLAQRFFGAGPTDIYFILQNLDDLISGLNAGNASSPCLVQAPVAYTVHPFGQSVDMMGQCYQQVGSSLVQWGVQDGTFYLWSVGGVELTAVIATPVSTSGAGMDGGGAAADAEAPQEGGDDGGAGDGGPAPQQAYAVHAWIGVGENNGAGGCGMSWDDCSYGTIELRANPVTASFEMTVAGVGFGYCGAQLVSDGANVYFTGSTDMGSTCNATDTLCATANGGTPSATCTPAEEIFSLTPMGRTASSGPATVATPGDSGVQDFAASAYPGGDKDTIVLDGTASDSVHRGASTTPTSGLGQYP